MLSPKDFFELTNYAHRDIFDNIEFVWQALGKLQEYLKAKLQPMILGKIMPGAYLEGDAIYIGRNTVVEPGAFIRSPAFIGDHCEVRQGAYVRGGVLTGNFCVIGHVTEVVRSILLDYVNADHFAYIGDSILGNKAHLGAGVKLANLKIRTGDFKLKLQIEGKVYDTGLEKLGAIFGDHAEAGCNTVTNPGTLVGRETLIYSGLSVRGYLPPRSIIKYHPPIKISPRKYLE